MHLNCHAVTGEGGRAIYFDGFAYDITERRRAERELKESEERYRGLFENANDIICTLDLGGNLTSVNRPGERIFGYGREQLIGRPPRSSSRPSTPGGCAR